jgi:hypothetical protein
LLIVARDGDRSRLGPKSLGHHTRFVVDHAPCPCCSSGPTTHQRSPTSRHRHHVQGVPDRGPHHIRQDHRPRAARRVVWMALAGPQRESRRSRTAADLSHAEPYLAEYEPRLRSSRACSHDHARPETDNPVMVERPALSACGASASA